MPITNEAIKQSLANHRNGSQYSDELKLEALSNFMVLGNITKTAELIGIPERTLYDWTKTDWWLEASTSIREEKLDEMDIKISNILDSGMNAINDRLDHGEVILDKENNEIRVPVKLRDAAWTFGVMFDKRQILRNAPTSITGNVGNEQLLDLKAQFEKLAGSVNAKVIEHDTD